MAFLCVGWVVMEIHLASHGYGPPIWKLHNGQQEVSSSNFYAFITLVGYNSVVAATTINVIPHVFLLILDNPKKSPTLLRSAKQKTKSPSRVSHCAIRVES